MYGTDYQIPIHSTYQSMELRNQSFYLNLFDNVQCTYYCDKPACVDSFPKEGRKAMASWADWKRLSTSGKRFMGRCRVVLVPSGGDEEMAELAGLENLRTGPWGVSPICYPVFHIFRTLIQNSKISLRATCSLVSWQRSSKWDWMAKMKIRIEWQGWRLRFRDHVQQLYSSFRNVVQRLTDRKMIRFSLRFVR